MLVGICPHCKTKNQLMVETTYYNKKGEVSCLTCGWVDYNPVEVPSATLVMDNRAQREIKRLWELSPEKLKELGIGT